MKKGNRGNRGFRYSGTVLFFLLIAAVVQIAVLVYDYISDKTEDNLTIALLMLAVIAAISLACTVIDVFRRHIMVDKPVDEILAATERIASGDFSVRLAPRHIYEKYDGFDLICENINTMAAELGKSEILKSDFISNVSHELKTPLAVIQNYAVLLKNDKLDSEERARCAETVFNATQRLAALVSNILKLNKLENQKIKPDFERVNLADMLADALIRHEELIESKALTLECDIDDVFVISSPTYLEIVWNNLISNAIKYTESGGTVGVRVKRRESGAEVEVFDTGCGISQETGRHIFEKFYQGDTSHYGEGNGLGLALVKKVIDVLGGEISVESVVGVGSTFTIVLKGIIDD